MNLDKQIDKICLPIASSERGKKILTTPERIKQLISEVLDYCTPARINACFDEVVDEIESLKQELGL